MQNENLPIDPSMLDEEWLNQPLLFDEAQQEAADAQKIRDELKDQLAQLEAEKGADIRGNFDKYGFAKAPTVQAVIDKLLVDTDIQELKKELNESQYNVNVANNTVRSLEMRKSALAKLTDLWIINYYYVPNENRLLAAGKRFIIERPDQSKEQSEKALEKLNDKKRKRADESKISTKMVKDDMKMRVENEIEKETEEVKQEVSKRRRRR